MQNRASKEIPTKPRKPAANVSANQTLAKSRKFDWKRSWPWALAIVLCFGAAAALGSLAGLRLGISGRQDAIQQLASQSLQEQYDLALQDLEAGRYEVARQRFEFILSSDPTFPGVTDKLAQAMAILYATATPTPPLPTNIPTPTFDPRPVQELFAHAQELFKAQDWNKAIDTLIAVRKADPAYMAARLDGMLYMSLRNRGIDKIWKEGNLGGGIYDLALAEKFTPLDGQSRSARELARLYLIGSSFWEVHPEQAVYYFSQVAAAAPGLRDASGWTASERYFEALIQYGDLLMRNRDFCNAQEQYELALQQRADQAVQTKAQEAALKCSPPTATPPAETPTATPSEPTATSPSGVTPTETQPVHTTQAPPPATTPAPPTSPPTPPTETSPAPTNTQPPPEPTATPEPEATTPPPDATQQGAAL